MRSYGTRKNHIYVLDNLAKNQQHVFSCNFLFCYIKFEKELNFSCTHRKITILSDYRSRTSSTYFQILLSGLSYYQIKASSGLDHCKVLIFQESTIAIDKKFISTIKINCTSYFFEIKLYFTVKIIIHSKD